jgi:hypothetical protein
MPFIAGEQVFLDRGASVWAWIAVPVLPTASLGNTHFVAWEPLPFGHEDFTRPIFSYSKVQLWEDTGLYYYGKLVANEGAPAVPNVYDTFLFLASTLP